MTDSSEDLILKQHHEMIVMKPVGSHKVTLIGRRLYSALLATAQLELNGNEPLATHTFESPLKTLLKSSVSQGEERTVAKRYFREMQDLKVTWESTAPGDGVKWVGIQMLSQAKIFVRAGQTWVSWAFPPDIMQMILKPDRYAVWNLRVSSQLGTYSALALYEICARYRDNPSGVTSRKPPEWWIDALSNTAPVDGKRREWRKFKVEKVNDAVAEINADTDLEIELLEHKAGRAVVEIQFAVRRKRMAALTAPKPVNADLVAQAERLGIAESRAESLITRFGEDAFALKLEDLRKRLFDKSKKPIDSPYAYLKVLLSNREMGEGRPVEAGIADKGKSSQSLPDQSNSAPPLAVATAVSTDAFKLIMQEINDLPEAERRQWLDKAVQELKDKNLYTAIVHKRAQEGRVSNGVLGGKVISLYAQATYGPNWINLKDLIRL